MPSAVTDYGQDFFAGVLFGSAYARPTSFYLALCTQVPARSTTGSTLSEPGGSYARVLIPNNNTVFGTPAGGVIANIASISFGVVATADWPVIYAYALCDASTAGNAYLYGTLRVPRATPIGHQVSFDPGLLTFSVNSISQTIVPSA